MSKALPRGWQEKKLIDFSPLQRGFDLPNSKIINGEYPIVYSNGIKAYHNEYKCKGVGVVTGRSGTIGKVTYVEKDYWPHNTSLWVTDFKGNLPKFVFYLLSYIDLSKYDAGTSVPTLNRNDVHKITVLVPPLDEQKRIADILSAFDDLIENLKKLIEKKEIYKKGVMQRVLSGEVRFNGFTDEWKTVKLKDILIAGSKDRVPDTSKYKKITIKLHNKGIEFSNIERKMADKRPFYIRKKDEIIIGKQNYFNGSIAIVDEEFDNTICSNAIMSFTVNKNCNNKFIYFLLSRKSYMQKYYHLANGTGQKELSESDFLNFNLLIPSLEEQNKIAELLTLIDQDIDNLKQLLHLRKLQKKGLMQKLLTGEVRI